MNNKAMTSREIVKRCIEFRDPPRIGMHFRTESIEGRVWNESDFAIVGYEVDPQFIRKPCQQEWSNEWGILRRSINTGLGEPVGFPLSEGWHLLEGYEWPDFTAPWRWKTLKENVDRGHAAGKYVYGHIPTLMQLSSDLRGMENWFMDSVLELENQRLVLERLFDVRVTIIEKYAAVGVDGVITWDDMGSGDRPLVSPATFRDLYFPYYKQTIDLLHQRGMHFIHHCCGQVREYMDMFIEAGCDVLQLDQPSLMGIEWLGENYGGKICFWNPIDIQTTIINGDFDSIDDEAHRQVWHLGNFGGGFMVKAYEQPESIEIPVENLEAQYQAFKKYKNYPITPLLK